IQEEKQEIFSLFESKSLKNARNKINEISNKIKDYSKVIQSIICNSLTLYFRTFFAFLEDENIERTSNKIEISFKKPFLKVLRS
ncbi:MAG: hypothetical protein KKH76_03420, partial [Euryarchaeota archaeon]|nr:hypothetical protein [Euryarchaeota archaeon]